MVDSPLMELDASEFDLIAGGADWGGITISDNNFAIVANTQINISVQIGNGNISGQSNGSVFSQA
jgi:hypothetical protein